MTSVERNLLCDHAGPAGQAGWRGTLRRLAVDVRNADILAAMTAAALPWSTSATAILIVLWLVVLVPTIDWDAFVHHLAHPACALPLRVCRARHSRRVLVGWHMVGGPARHQTSRKTADDPVSALSLSAVAARHLGFCRLPRFMHADDDPVLDRTVRIRRSSSRGPFRTASRSRTISTRARSSRCVHLRWRCRR